MTSPTALWIACPADDGEHWLPWQPISGHLRHPLIAPLSAAEAHRIARGMRDTFHGHLIAVRPDDGSQPVWPALMVDHYDLPPYTD